MIKQHLVLDTFCSFLQFAIWKFQEDPKRAYLSHFLQLVKQYAPIGHKLPINGKESQMIDFLIIYLSSSVEL